MIDWRQVHCGVPNEFWMLWMPFRVALSIDANALGSVPCDFDSALHPGQVEPEQSS